MLNPDHVQTGALLAEHGKLDEAADVYWRNLAKCEARLAKEPRHAETIQLLDLLIVRLGILAEQFVERGRFATALEHAQGLTAISPERLRLHATRAHAMMFIGREDAAEKLYLHYRGQKIGGDLWESAVVADFNKYRQAGRSHPLMDKVERLFERKDWFQPPENVSAKARVGVIDIAAPQADDIPSGDRLVEEGKFDEALDVYRRRIEISLAKLTNGRANLQALADRQTAIERMSDLAFRFTVMGDFQKANDVADNAIQILPNAISPNLRRAHALMFLDRCDEARELYRRFVVGKATTELTWQDVIRGDFLAIHNAGLSHSLMTEIEQSLLTS
jgi:Tfp pilus assembly protein PilF